MNICKGNKIVLIKEFDKLNVGETYEVCNLTDTYVIVRDVNTKVALAAIDVDSFAEYFSKPEQARKWTPWQSMVNRDGSHIGFYRTNQKKVQVRSNEGYRAESACHATDEFNLRIGLNLASLRCTEKHLVVLEDMYAKSLEAIRSELEKTRHSINSFANYSVSKESE